MKYKTQKMLRNGLKLGLAGSSITAIAALFLFINAPDEMVQDRSVVQQAKADIWDGAFTPVSKQERFEKSLKEMGMSKPKSYQHNGNRMYFSFKLTNETPAEVMDNFQAKFRENGVNKYEHRGPAAKVDNKNGWPSTKLETARSLHSLAQANDFFSGGMVPVNVQRNHMSMVGVETEGEANHALDAIAEWHKSDNNADKLLDSIRYVEAFREEGSNKTHVTAVWSDDGFDLGSFRPENTARNPAAYTGDIPPCSQCRPLGSLDGEGSEAGFQASTYVTKWNPAMTRDHYVHLMTSRGWKLDSSHMVGEHWFKRNNPQHHGADSLVFMRGNRMATIQINHDPDLDATVIKSMSTN